MKIIEFKYDIPSFEAIFKTFTKKPAVDFNLKVADLEIMNLGPANFHVLTLVRNLVNTASTVAMLHPKKRIIPIVSDVDTKSLAILRPVAMLMLSIDRAASLKPANLLLLYYYFTITITITVNIYIYKNENHQERWGLKNTPDPSPLVQINPRK